MHWWNLWRAIKWVVARIVCMKSVGSCVKRGSGSIWMAISSQVRCCKRHAVMLKKPDFGTDTKFVRLKEDSILPDSSGMAVTRNTVFFEIALMVFLGRVKLGSGHDFGHDRVAPAPALQ